MDWPRRFFLTLQFSEPDAWVGVVVPIDPCYMGTPVVDVNGVGALQATSFANLVLGAPNRYIWDPSMKLLYIRIATGGTIGGDPRGALYDGTRTTSRVNTP